MNRDEQTAFIRRTQAKGIIFVCPDKDRALSAGEQACENCTCISGAAPISREPQVDVRLDQ